MGRASSPPVQADVTLSEMQGVRYLHLGTPWVQGAMRISKPLAIELEYVRRMMAWLLWTPWEDVPGRCAVQLGLGAGALTRFCHGVLGMHTEAVEQNPAVIQACRQFFYLPRQGPRFRVWQDDAAAWVAQRTRRGTVDALQVDLYDHEAASPLLDHADFYANCRDVLSADGIMTINLFGRQSSLPHSMGQMAQAFGAEALWAFGPTREGNTVVLAHRNPERARQYPWRAQAVALQQRLGWRTERWQRVLRQNTDSPLTP